MLRKIVITLLVFATVTACKDTGIDGGTENPFTRKETLGVYNNDKNLFVYDKDLFQYAFNSEHLTFRIQNSGQDRYMICELQSQPVVNETLSVRLETKGISSLPTQGLEVRVLKMSGGKIWLWNAEKNLGLIIRLE